MTFSNYGVSSIWITSNGGENWIEKEGNLPDMPIRWGIFHPENINYAMIATEIGIWETSNLLEENAIWSPSVSGLANVRVDMLSIRESDNMVVAASHGRGLFYGIYNSSPQLIGDLNNDNIVNVLDIILLVNFILDGQEYSANTDINSDNEINILDIIALVNMILEN